MREERWKEEGRQVGGEERREGRSDAQSSGSNREEESESLAGRGTGRSDGKQTGQKGGVLEMCGGVADKCATRQEMRFIVFFKKKEKKFDLYSDAMAIAFSTSLLVTHVGFAQDDRKDI